MSECLTPAVLDSLAAGALSPEDKTRAEEHLASCERCRQEFESRKSSRTISKVPGPIPAGTDDIRTRLRKSFGPALVGLLCSGLFSLAIAAAAMQVLINNCARVYGDFPSVPTPWLASVRLPEVSSMGHWDQIVIFVFVTICFYGMGLLSAMVARPRDHAEDMSVGLITGLSASFAALPVFAWATVLALTVVPALPDLTAFDKATRAPTETEIKIAERSGTKPLAEDILVERYADLKKVPENERGKKFFPKVVADQVIGSAVGVAGGIAFALATAGVVGFFSSLAGGYLLRRREDFSAIMLPYVELTVPVTLLVSASLLVLLALYPLDAGDFVPLWSFALLALLTVLAWIGVTYRWDWLLRVTVYVAYFCLIIGIRERSVPPAVYLLAGTLVVVVLARYLVPWQEIEMRKVYAGLLLVLLTGMCVVFGLIIGGRRAEQNQPVRVLVARDTYPAASALLDPRAMFEEADSTEGTAPNTYISPNRLDEYAKRILRWDLRKGDILTLNHFQPPELDTKVPSGKRLFTIKVDVDTPGVAVNGTHADAILSGQHDNKPIDPKFIVGNVLLRTVAFLPDVNRRAVTLEVDPAQMLVLSRAQEYGSIFLVARPFGDVADVKGLEALPPSKEIDWTKDTPDVATDEKLPESVRQQLASKLEPGMQTFTIKRAAGETGELAPGTPVDVVLTLPHGEGASLAAQKLRVLDRRHMGPDQMSVDDGPTGTVTLEVTPKQAAILTRAEKLGKLQLALRPVDDHAEVDSATGKPKTTDKQE